MGELELDLDTATTSTGWSSALLTPTNFCATSCRTLAASSPDGILTALWNAEGDGSDNTAVRWHIKPAPKLEADPANPELLLNVGHHGYMLAAPKRIGQPEKTHPRVPPTESRTSDLFCLNRAGLAYQRWPRRPRVSWLRRPGFGREQTSLGTQNCCGAIRTGGCETSWRIPTRYGLDKIMVARILLLEGAAEREESLAPRLSAEGFDVLAERDPAKGVQMASEKQPDVVVINGRLPGCSASDIVKQLHTAEPTGLLPVVQIVDSAPHDPQTLLDDGADDYLARPRLARLFGCSAHARRCASGTPSTTGASSRRAKVVQALSHEVFYPLLEIEANGEYLARSEAVAGASAVADTGREIVSAAHRLHRMLGKLMLAATLEEETAGAESRLPAGGQTADAYAIVKQTAVQTAQLCGREEELVLALEPAWAQVAAVDLEWIVRG